MNKMTERLVLGAAALVVGLAVGWAVRGVATYNTAMETVTGFQDWRIACPPAAAKDQSCEMIEECWTETGSPVVRIAITSDKDKPELGADPASGRGAAAGRRPGAGHRSAAGISATAPATRSAASRCWRWTTRRWPLSAPPRTARSWSPGWTASRWRSRFRSRVMATPRAPITAPKRGALPGSGDWRHEIYPSF